MIVAEGGRGDMVIEATYASGRGILIGAESRWLLIADPGDEHALAELWTAVQQPPPAGLSVTDSVLPVAERVLGAAPVALALIDFAAEVPLTLTRGTASATHVGTAWLLRLDAHDEGASDPKRPMIGGIVGAAAVWLSPDVPEVQGLIDGIPEAVLAATGPDGPPPPRARQHTPEWVSSTHTGTSVETTDPLPEDVAERIEEGGHTTIRAPHPVDDHDGSTVHRPPHLVQPTVPTVLAVSCPLGHLTPPTAPSCRLCHQRVAPQEPRQVPRPTLGGLRLPTGEVVPLDRGVVLGRKPAPIEGSTDWPHLVHLPANHSFVSRRHLQIDLDGWDVVARDLDSRGGTTLVQPGGETERMRPGEDYLLESGAVLDLAEVYAVRYETGPGSGR